MKKVFLAIMLVLSVILPSLTLNVSASNLVIKVNDKQLSNSPFISNGTTYVPLNEIAEKMGEAVTSIDSQKKVVIQGNNFTVSVKDGQTFAVLNGKIVPLKIKKVDGKEVNAELKSIYKNGQVYVPLEFISSGNGMTYAVETINEDNQTIIYIGDIPSAIKNEISKRPIVLKVNNKQVSSKGSPFRSNGTTYVALNEITKLMGSEVYPGKNEVNVGLAFLASATIKAGESTASIYESQKNSRDRTKIVPLRNITINGRTTPDEAKAISKNGQIFVPVEFISSTDGMNYIVETVKDKSKTSIYVGELPSSLQKSIKKQGYATKIESVTKYPGSIYSSNRIVKNQQFYILSEQDGLYKIKVGKHLGYVEKDAVKIGKTPAKGKMYSDGWVAPKLKSKWSKNPQVNYKTLQNELGFSKDGMVYDVFGAVRGIQVIHDGGSSTEVGISFFLWKTKEVEQSYRIPIVAKEVFKLYFGKDANRVWNYFNRNDIPEKFTANGRTVKAQFIEPTGSLYLQVGYKK
ncbi:stalk domain-containing protein [Bacillus sp. 31A1R]|uniref:Stalk domain-containing protein n=1 Tax=Robertmurraya mangrovi TaxID=3098077 RepID=A0ABU5IYT7_9BACI|nr:stalk domain-containing protein [Bacillus sp. 31A1R]MDZ5472335.1 stalk domain-containing protein [Bacillus sp. 31A1R]